MEIKKILFISMFSFMCSVNSFTKPLSNENVAKEINSKDLDNIKFKKVTCEYNEPDKLSKKDLKNNDSGYLYVVSIKKVCFLSL